MFGINQRIANEEEGRVIEIELHAHEAEENGGRAWIKDLQDAEPDEDEESGKKRGTRDDEIFVSAAIGQEEREIDDSGEDVFGEIDRHVISGVFADEVFEEQPGDEAINAVAPISEDGENESAGDADHQDERKADHVVGKDQAGEFVGAKEGDGEEDEADDEAAMHAGTEGVGDSSHSAASKERSSATSEEIGDMDFGSLDSRIVRILTSNGKGRRGGSRLRFAVVITGRLWRVEGEDVASMGVLKSERTA